MARCCFDRPLREIRRFLCGINGAAYRTRTNSPLSSGGGHNPLFPNGIYPRGVRADDERRYAIFDCSDEHRGDTVYFKAMIEQMNNGGLEAMLYDLLTYEPENGWDSINTAPITSGLKEQVVESLRGIEKFWYSLVKDGMYECDGLLEGGIYLDEEHGRSISMKELRKAVRDYLADHYHGKKLATYDLIELTVREWCNAMVVTKTGFQNDARWVEFPSATECRAHIRRHKGLEIAPPTRSETDQVPKRTGHLKAVASN